MMTTRARTEASAQVVALLAAVALVGCTPLPKVAQQTHAVAVAPAPAPAQWLVWTRARDAKSGETTERTAFIDAEGRTVSESAGIVLVLDGELWRWETDAKKVTLEACPDQDARESTVGNGRLVQVGAKGSVRTVLPSYFDKTSGGDHDGGALTIGEVNQDFEVSGSIGPYLFVREHTWVNGCGAHGLWSTAPHVIDARSGAAITLDDPSADAPATSQLAVERFTNAFASKDATDDSPPFFGELGPSDTQYVASEPRFSGSQMDFVHVYLADVPYAFGASSWRSYAVDTEVPAPLPKAFASDVVAPPSVVRFAVSTRDRVVGGWTRL